MNNFKKAMRMRNTFTVLVLTSIIFFTLFSTSYAAVEWNFLKTYNIKAAPVDMAISKYGRWIFVLTKKGEVLIYSQDGALNGKIPVGSFIDGIKPGPSENLLLISSRKRKTVQVITFDFIQKINVTGSPFRGPPNVPVVIVVFADFQ